MDNTKQYAIKCFKDEAQAILDLIPQLTDDFDKAIELVYNCKGKFIITGVGKSGHIGQKIAATLASTGTPSFFVNPLDAYHGDLGMFSDGDIVLAISNSGNTDELLRFVPLLLERKIPIISMSGNPNSLLAQYSVCHLNIAVKHEACPLNLAPTSSTTATLAMGDALACALMEVRHFKASDFALYHPGGSLGRKLLTKVKDVMRTEDLPIVSKEMTVMDTMFVISQGKLCLAVVMDEERILGVVSDGDIRRAITKGGKDSLDIKIENIMNIYPVVIKDSDRVVVADTLLKEKNIHSILVVNDTNKLVGIMSSYNSI